ncbi:MAG: hypothetical protein K0U47_04965 [Epsilonproteobacteria bacterium]|nr:hypothetical protein [Campylobacterota bacterium]
MIFYCQSCDHQIDLNMLAELESGKCPKCEEIKGFATAPAATMRDFDQDATVLNDTDFLKSTASKGTS